MMLTKEQLLQPRYKVTGPFPHMNCKVGDILDFSDGYSSKQITKTPYDDSSGETNYATHGFDEFELQEYPNLFQPLPWWSDRKPEDMPEYVTDGKCVVSASWHEDIATIDGTEWLISNDIMRLFQPAKKEEYLAYTSKH